MRWFSHLWPQIKRLSSTFRCSPPSSPLAMPSVPLTCLRVAKCSWRYLDTAKVTWPALFRGVFRNCKHRVERGAEGRRCSRILIRWDCCCAETFWYSTFSLILFKCFLLVWLGDCLALCQNPSDIWWCHLKEYTKVFQGFSSLVEYGNLPRKMFDNFFGGAMDDYLLRSLKNDSGMYPDMLNTMGL